MGIKGKGLTEPQISAICKSILYSIDYLHSQNKVHRDIKAGNF